MDAARGQPVDTIRGFGFPYRIAITPEGRTAIVTDPVRGEVRIIDVQTRHTRKVIPFPGPSDGSAMPEGVTTSDDGTRAFVTLEATGTVVAIDVETARVLWTASVGSSPDGIAYAAPVR
jgi:YVTN family beta-propeller protein